MREERYSLYKIEKENEAIDWVSRQITLHWKVREVRSKGSVCCYFEVSEWLIGLIELYTFMKLTSARQALHNITNNRYEIKVTSFSFIEWALVVLEEVMEVFNKGGRLLLKLNFL